MPNVTAGNSVTSSAQLNTGVVTTGAILDNTIAKADVGTGAVGTDEILDGEIVNADINSAAAIALSKLANGTQGDVLIRTTGGVTTALAAGTLDYYLSANGAGADPSWKVLPAPRTVTISTAFETAARFTTAVTGSGAGSFGASGRNMSTGGGVAGSSNTTMGIAPQPYLGDPAFSALVQYTDPGGGSNFTTFVGIGSCTVATAGITFTDRHIGFKTVGTSLYATVADGTTENASAALTTITSTDTLDLYFKVTGSSSVAFYWRKNGGSWSSATTLSSNLPSGTTTTLQWATSSNSSANGYTLNVYGAVFER